MDYKNGSRDSLHRRRYTNQRTHTSQHTRRHKIVCPRNDGLCDSLQGESKARILTIMVDNATVLTIGKMHIQHMLERCEQMSAQKLV